MFTDCWMLTFRIITWLETLKNKLRHQKKLKNKILF